MGTLYIPESVRAGFQSQATINANFDAIQSALADSLSRKGGSDNEMEDTLDMNSNRLINLPAPTSVTEPVTIAYLNTLTPPPAVANVGNPMPLDLDFGGFKGVNAGDPTGAQDYVTLNYFDNNPADSAGASPIDADTLDGFDTSTLASDLTPDTIVRRDASGDLFTNFLTMQADTVLTQPSRVAVELSSNGQLRWQTFAQFKAFLGNLATPTFDSGKVALSTFSSRQTFPHGLTGIPALVIPHIICTTNDGDYVVGDRLVINPASNDLDEGTVSDIASGLSILVDTTNITCRQDSDLAVPGKSGATSFVVNTANWDLQLLSVGVVANP